MALSKFLRSFHATFVAVPVHVVTVKSKGGSVSKLENRKISMASDITTVVSSQEKT